MSKSWGVCFMFELRFGKKIKVFFTFSCILILSLFSLISAKSACIIIHGTWAQNETWHGPDGDFFKSVDRCAKELEIVDEVISFCWSGKLSYASQWQAAKNLVKIISCYDSVILIGHSHGVTVGIIASQILGQKNSSRQNLYKIDKFYSLGVPVDKTQAIYPDMSVIGTFYNFFSFGDYIQLVNGLHVRVFAPHERLINISVLFDDHYPSHGQLHDAWIGKELLKIDQFFKIRCLGNFNNFCLNKPSCIQFFTHDLPWYQLQPDQSKLLEFDEKVQRMMTAALFRKQK
jgi:hypothetical protein